MAGPVVGLLYEGRQMSDRELCVSHGMVVSESSVLWRVGASCVLVSVVVGASLGWPAVRDSHQGLSCVTHMVSLLGRSPMLCSA